MSVSPRTYLNLQIMFPSVALENVEFHLSDGGSERRTSTIFRGC